MFFDYEDNDYYDYSTESVGICFCFLFFPYKAYLFILVVTNTIQAMTFTIVGILRNPVSFGLIGLGGLHLVIQSINVFKLVRNSVLTIGQVLVLFNCLTSLIDLAAGVFLLVSCFTTLEFLNLNKVQQDYLRQESRVCEVVGSFIIGIGFFGFWLTYLQYETIKPFQAQLDQKTQIMSAIPIKEAVARRFHTNYIQELTPHSNQFRNNVETNNDPNLRTYKQSNDSTPKHGRTQLIQSQSQFRSDQIIKLETILQQQNEDQQYYYPSSQTIRIPSQMELQVEMWHPNEDKQLQVFNIKYHQESSSYKWSKW